MGSPQNCPLASGYHYIVKCLSEQGQGHSPPSSLPLSPSPLSSSPPLPPPFLSAVQMVAALPTAHGALSVSAAVGLDVVYVHTNAHMY